MSAPVPDRSACQAAREELLAFLAPSGSAAPASFHCADCGAWFARARKHSGVISSLPRACADFAALEGRVVAELNAGRRQERATSELASLERLAAPAELDSLVHERLIGTLRGAPDELERRVALELASGASPRIGRQIGSLERVRVPAELEARVAGSLARIPRSDSIPLRRWIAIAAALFVVFGAAALLRQSSFFRAPSYEFRVVHTSSTADLDPFSRSLLAQASGVPEEFL